MSGRLRKYLRYILVGKLIIIGLFVLLYGIAMLYVHLHKKDLIEKIHAELLAKYQTKVSIEDLSLGIFSTFPNPSLHATGLVAKGPMYQIHHQPLFSASTLRISIKLLDLLLLRVSVGKVALQNGNLFIYTDTSGISNLSFFKKEGVEKTKSESPSFPSNLIFTNFTIQVLDLHKEKNFHFLLHKLHVKTETKGDSSTYTIDKEMQVKSLAFNSPNGSFIQNKTLTGKYRIYYHTKRRALHFEDISMAIDKQPFTFTGTFNIDSSQHFTLDIDTKQLNYEFAKTLVLPHISKALSIVSLTNPLNVRVKLDGPLNGGDPLVIANWTTSGTRLISPLLNIDSASFSGMFTNEVVKGLPRKDPNSKIELTALTGYWEGIPFSAPNISVLNLSKPMVTGAFSSTFNLNAFNNVVKSDALQFSNGTGKLNVKYTGPLDSISKKNASIDIGLVITKGSIAVVPLNLTITECITDIAIRNADISINNLSATGSDGSKINIWGTAKNTLALLDEDPGKVSTNIHVYSPYLNLNDISKLLRGKSKSTTNKKKSRLSKAIQRIDQLLEKETIALDLRADKLQHRNLKASNFTANVKLVSGNWAIEQARFDIAGGSIAIKAGVSAAQQQAHKLSLSATITNVDAPTLMYAFDNFGLKGIKHYNLTGRIHARTNIETYTDKRGSIARDRLAGNLFFSLKNGSIKNLPALEEIKLKFLQKRHLNDLRFAEISNQLSIVNGIVTVPRMQIESSAFRCFIEGQYGLVGNTDLRIQVPLSNLSAPDSGYIPKKTKANKRGGPSIYLRARTGDDGKMKIGLDALGAFRKTNAKPHSPIHP